MNMPIHLNNAKKDLFDAPILIEQTIDLDDIPIRRFNVSLNQLREIANAREDAREILIRKYNAHRAALQEYLNNPVKKTMIDNILLGRKAI